MSLSLIDQRTLILNEFHLKVVAGIYFGFAVEFIKRRFNPSPW